MRVTSWIRGLKKALLTLVLTCVVVVLMLWLTGVFHPKVGAARAGLAVEPVGDRKVELVRTLCLPNIESAVGTIRPVNEAYVASKVMERVKEINFVAGQHVREGDVLVRLDDTLLNLQLGKAKANLAAAKAKSDMAQTQMDAMTRAFKVNAATSLQVQDATNAWKYAQSEVQASEQAVNEAVAQLAYTTIRSPMEGVVIDKKVNFGDTVMPGQVLLTMYNRMQLVASVPESLTQRLTVGQEIEVYVDALKRSCRGHVSEIVPEAQSASRTFLVKVTGSCQPGTYPGMFGRLRIPLDNQDVLVVPAGAVVQVGQLDIVQVAQNGALQRRSVQLGRSLPFEGKPYVEVLSGLRAGESVVVGPPPAILGAASRPTTACPVTTLPSGGMDP